MGKKAKEPLGRTARIAIALAALAVVSVATVRIARESGGEAEASPVASYGKLLPADATSEHSIEGCDAADAANRSGMTGAEAKADLHGNAAGTMWCDSPEDGRSAAIVFDLGRVEPLGEMWVWNFNEAEATGSGIKDAKIFLSADGEAWDEWKGEGYPYRFAAADGSGALAATNLDGEEREPVRFGGQPARYVKVEADADAGKGNWSSAGERKFGLSEVRFYRYARKVVYQGRIDAVGAKDASMAGDAGDASDAEGASHPENVVNGYGMTGSSEKKAAHGNDPAAMWLTAAKQGTEAEEAALTVDLGGTYPLGEMRVWNYNGIGDDGAPLADRGLRDVTIFYSIDGIAWSELKGDGYPYRLAKADGSDELAATNLDGDGAGQAIAFGGASARYVKLAPSGGAGTGNWGAKDGDGQAYFGLSELRFYSGAGIAAEPAPEWTGLFSRFERWTGADGIFSIPLDGYDQPGKTGEATRTAFLFSDTFAGRVNGVSGIRETGSLVNNSVGMLDGAEPDPAKMRFDVAPNSADLSLFTPHTKASDALPGSWYWLQDGYARDGYLYLFPILMAKDPSQASGFQFAIRGVSLIKVPVGEDGPDYEKQVQTDTPLYGELEGGKEYVFGAGISDNTEASGAPNPDGYLYVYGYENDQANGKKKLMVARTKPETIESFADWRFWNGSDWTTRIEEAATLLDGVSPELSVTPMAAGPWKGKYVAVFEQDSVSGKVAYAVGDSPVGPFGEPTPIFYTAEIADGQGIITYNAKAHPHLSDDGELLVTYNVNTTDAMASSANANIYRPRWLTLREIAPE